MILRWTGKSSKRLPNFKQLDVTFRPEKQAKCIQLEGIRTLGSPVLLITKVAEVYLKNTLP